MRMFSRAAWVLSMIQKDNENHKGQKVRDGVPLANIPAESVVKTKDVRPITI
jgi:hypothetical protein